MKVLVPGGMSEPFWYDLPESSAATEAADNGSANQMPLAGAMVQVPLNRKTVAGVVVETGRPELAFKTKPLTRFAPNHERVPAAWVDLMRWLGEYYLTPLPQVFAACLPKPAVEMVFPKRPAKPVPTENSGQAVAADRADGAKVTRKLRKGIPAENHPAPFQTGSVRETANIPDALRPTEEQRAAIDSVAESLAAETFQTYLLHGVTGSGKTLVYLHLARLALAAGKRVLVLLPEIALTPQTLSRFREFLGRPVLALHSNLGAKSRRELWSAVFQGSADVIVGARSAVLAPVDNLGLIVVDEEHDGSYKQSDAAPRYHARDLALYRGRQASCPVVLGSATPSLESYQAAVAGKYRLLELKSRATGSRPPSIRVVDMREQFALQGPLLISIPLREALQAALEQGGQAILFLNRRGYAHKRVCQSCGCPRECPHCIAPLVYHKARQTLLCHYCGFKSPPDAPCRKCGGTEWLDTGRGIEKVQEYLEGIFPGVGIARLDRDSTSTLGGAEKILGRFKSGELQLLLGTQMVAKGHDFPKVNLVGVIDADSGLGLSDFRAQERAFQLITQVAGRAGRHQGIGEVYLQSFRPENPLLAFALTGDYLGFFREEIERRRELEYPPFRRMLLIEITGEDERVVDEHMREFSDLFRHFADQADIIVLGPAFAVLKKIKDQYRAHLIAKGKAGNRLQWAFAQTLERFKPKQPNKTKLRADMDPVSML